MASRGPVVPTDLEQLIYVRRLISTGEAMRRRKEAGLSQSEVAKACGVAVMTIHRWENGKRQPRGQTAQRYLAVLELLVRAAV